MSDLRTVLRDIGGILIIIGVITLFALIVPVYFGEYYALVPLLITSGVYFAVGIPLYLLFKKAELATFKTAMVTAAFGWFLVSLIGVIPFILISYDKINQILTMDFLSAFFESMSGWTGTGLTMIDKENLVPYTLQFWRTLIQWIGGVGVIVLTLSILARPGTGSYILYKSEGREKKTHPSIVSTVRTIWWIFLLYTIIGIVALIVISVFDPSGGMDPWQSLNHAMTGIATGGFSVTDDSIASFGTISQFVIVILMVLGGVAFAAHYDLIKGRIKKFLFDAQFQAMAILIIVGVIALALINLNSPDLSYNGNFFLSLKESGFQFISAITCTGFASADIPIWTESAKLILSFAMVIGGAAGSTAGGIKLFRAILLGKGAGWRIKRSISSPRRVFVHKLGDKPLSKDDAIDLINEAAIISFMWVILIFVGVMIISFLFPQETLGNVIFEVCSAQGNVGLSTGITTIEMPSFAKIMLIFNMWVGRLEIIPIIVLVRSILGIRGNIP